MLQPKHECLRSRQMLSDFVFQGVKSAKTALISPAIKNEVSIVPIATAIAHSPGPLGTQPQPCIRP